MERYDPDIHKIFVIDYFFVNDFKRVVRSHWTYATSRKNAEYNTRQMEGKTPINIIKLTPVELSKEFHDIVDERIATHKEQNINFDPDYMNDDEDEISPMLQRELDIEKEENEYWSKK